VLIVDGIVYSLQTHGGISVYFNELLKRLRQNNIDHRAMLFQGASTLAREQLGPRELASTRWAERYRRCRTLESASVFHSSYYRLPSRKIPTVTTVHDFTYERFVKGPRQWLHSWQKFAAIRGSQAIICVSESTQRDLFHFLPDIHPDRVRVIHNGVSEAFFPLEATAKPLEPWPYVLFVGARSGYKNFPAVVEALRQRPDLGLVCVGGGPLSPEEVLFLKRALGARFVHRVGVSDQELNALYNGAHTLMYPSAYEGFGIPVLEAMRAGCPVIAVSSSSIPEVAGNAALLVAKADPGLLGNALAQLEQHGQRECLRQAGFKRCGHFSWQRTYEETLAVYDSVGITPQSRGE
jgi:mannosyltransferase